MSKKVYITLIVMFALFATWGAMYSCLNYGFDMVLSSLLAFLISWVSTGLVLTFN